MTVPSGTDLARASLEFRTADRGRRLFGHHRIVVAMLTR
jgi:hypothetical protein